MSIFVYTYYKKDSGLVVSWSLVKKIGESLGLVKLRLARKLHSLLSIYVLCSFDVSLYLFQNYLKIRQLCSLRQNLLYVVGATKYDSHHNQLSI